MAGLIPYFKIGRAVRFRKTELDAALERMQVGAVVKSIKVGAQVGEALW
jgi:hypothetical protein